MVSKPKCDMIKGNESGIVSEILAQTKGFLYCFQPFKIIITLYPDI